MMTSRPTTASTARTAAFGLLAGSVCAISSLDEFGDHHNVRRPPPPPPPALADVTAVFVSIDNQIAYPGAAGTLFIGDLGLY